jgi:heterodisulfide reductase subunit A
LAHLKLGNCNLFGIWNLDIGILFDAVRINMKDVDTKEIIPEALVIGAGIAGMQASLDIASKGFKVHLVEKDPSIGGHMAQLDKTFPTLDCSSCIITPKMVETGNHPNINLLSYSEVIEVNGSVGHFHIKVKKKPTYVNSNKCTGCGDCVEACILKKGVPSEFDVGMVKRKAVYISFPQAVPLKAVIDDKSCLFLSRGKCKKACVQACKAEAIDFDQKEEIIELKVGSIVVATGFDPFDPKLKPEFGYGVYPNVLHGLELERLCSASGPTKGEILIQGKKPKEVVFIHCVGSRDKTVGNEYCSRVCCMSTAKQAHLIREHIPDAQITVLYMDVRAFGKGFEEFYERVQKENIIYRRTNPSEVYRRNGKLVVRGEDTLLGEPFELEADLIVLASGLVPRKEDDLLKDLLGLKKSSNRFYAEAPGFDPVVTEVEGVFLAGCCQSPKDIPDTVSQASGAASLACVILAKGRNNAKSQSQNSKSQISTNSSNPNDRKKLF